MPACQLGLIQVRYAILLCIRHNDWTLRSGTYHPITDAANKYFRFNRQQISSETGVTGHSDYFDNYADSVLRRRIAYKQDSSAILVVYRFSNKHINPTIYSWNFENERSLIKDLVNRKIKK